ncbi:YbhN family protein [Halothiobacillus sp. DCM-1]|uniref:lysylphosphatidylglycerol synthase transmembrane domain-containing protein n=1 Tax=Halothiobacillus sp. DCM-1 TaxID=3112558 RepID=UPI0032563E5F
MRERSSTMIATLLWLLVLAGLATAVIWIGPDRLIQPWQMLSWPAILLALGLMSLSYWLRALRIQRYFLTELRGQFWPCLRLTTWHILLNNLLPMRSGELSFPVLMQRYFGLPATRSVPVLLWFRLLDLQVLVLIGLGIAILGSGLSELWLLPVGLLLPAPLVVYWLRVPLKNWLIRRPARAWKAPLLAGIDSLPQHPRALLAALGWTLANWIVKVGTLAWLLSQWLPVSIPGALAGAIGGDLTTILPIHAPGGFGTFEAGVILALQPFTGHLPAIAAAALNLHLFLLSSSVLASVWALWIRIPRPTATQNARERFE